MQTAAQTPTTTRPRWLVTAAPVLLIVIAGAALVALGPEERTLGDGIRSVYAHVPLTVVGRLALTLAGVVGFGVLLTGHARLRNWAQSLGWVGWSLLGAGFLVSLYSSHDNWGAVFWDEPRTVAVSQILALSFAVLFVNTWRTPIRVQGGLLAFMTLAMTYLLTRADLVLHPSNPITTSTSLGIQATFAALLLLALVGAGWLVWRQAHR